MIPISTVERETGLSKDTLRKWEARYGFPRPERRPNGERFYIRADLDRLRAIKRLMDTGLKPSRIVPLPIDILHTLATQQCGSCSPGADEELSAQVSQALKSTAPEELKNILYRAVLSYGLSHFVLAIMTNLNRLVGDGWVTGTFTIYQEHLYSETIRNLLLELLAPLRPLPDRPRVLLTTPPDERHDLGAVMVQTVFTLSGAHCIYLGTETPAVELAAAASGYQAQIVAISFSTAFPSRRVKPYLNELKSLLPLCVQVWAGGAAIDRYKGELPGIHTFADLQLALAALAKFSTS